MVETVFPPIINLGLPVLVFWLLGLLCLSFLISFVHNHYRTDLHKFNGPYLASYTNFWRLCHAYRHQHEPPMLSLHATYGDIVRLGPRVLSFAHPQAIKDIHGTGELFKKSPFYPFSAAATNGKYIYTLFSSIDENWHDKLRKSVNWIFTQTAAASYESIVDNTLTLFQQVINKRFANKPGGGVLDLPQWALYFTFDVMGDLTYSRRYGFLEEARDIDGIIALMRRFLAYGFYIGQVPALDLFFKHNFILMWLARRGVSLARSFGIPAVIFAKKQLQERQERHRAESNKGLHPRRVNAEEAENSHEDLLDRLLRAKADYPEIMTDSEITSMSLSLLFAGSETTAITLSAIFYHLLRNPHVYEKLQKKIDEHPSLLQPSNIANSERKMPQVRLARFAEAQRLPYLSACIQETFRMHPPFGTMYERVVPSAGATICGVFVPGGTIVGCNPWVVQRNCEVFGADAHLYRPERWLIDDVEKVKRMHRSMYQFGGGNHLCMGRHIAYLEIYKVVATLLGVYQMEMEDPAKECTLTNGGAVRISNFKVHMKTRE